MWSVRLTRYSRIWRDLRELAYSATSIAFKAVIDLYFKPVRILMTDRKAGLPEKRFQFGRRIRSLANRAVTADRVWLLRRPLLRRRGEAAVIGTKPTTPVPELFGDVAEPPGRGKWWLWFTFFGFVVLPTLVAFSYYGFIASRQYRVRGEVRC